MKSKIKILKTSERFIGPVFWPLIKQRILSERIPLKITLGNNNFVTKENISVSI